MQNACSSLEQRERDYSVLQAQLRDLTNSRSWKVSAPLRILVALLSLYASSSVHIGLSCSIHNSFCQFLFNIYILSNFSIIHYF